ncbi:hypothetical protein [Micromonospora sp. NPDC049679]
MTAVMIGGYEYRVRERFPVQTGPGLTTRRVDDLTAPVAEPSRRC